MMPEPKPPNDHDEVETRAAALQEKAKLAGKRVGLILSVGNIDFDLFRKWVGTDSTATAQRAIA